MKKKLGICQLGDKDYASQRPHALKSVENYCIKHGYDWIGLSGTLDTDTHLCYQKPLLLLENFDKYEYLGFLDMDITIVNRAVKIHEFFESLPDQDIFVTSDPGHHDLNSGSVWIKTTPLAKQVMEAWWESRYKGVDKPWRQPSRTKGEDQGRLIRLLKANNLLTSNYVSPHYLNIFPRNFLRGDWLIHFMGHACQDYEPYIEFANNYIKDSEQDLLDIYWLVYSRECADFHVRTYEYGKEFQQSYDTIMSQEGLPRYSPAEVYFAAKEIIKHNIEFFIKNTGPLYNKFI
jgi:hypothetical protein